MMLEKQDFIWKEHFANNIPTNPLEEYYCIIDCGNNARKYSIIPQYPSDDGISEKTSEKPECYVFFESIGRKATENDKKNFFYNYIQFDGYIFDKASFIRVYKTLDEAKERAYVQYKAIFQYVLSHIERNTDLATQHHFCVN